MLVTVILVTMSGVDDVLAIIMKSLARIDNLEPGELPLTFGNRLTNLASDTAMRMLPNIASDMGMNLLNHLSIRYDSRLWPQKIL